MDFIIVTGMSGSGKSCVINALEDSGFFCVDNLPSQLIPTFAKLIKTSGEYSRVAVVTDIRAGISFGELFSATDTLKELEIDYKLLFVDAKDDVLIRRFKETRRKHPLMESGEESVSELIVKERALLNNAREHSDYLIETTNLSYTQCRSRILDMFSGKEESTLHIQCVSFGFKHGTPSDADYIFDLRFLPNPFYVPELKKLTGLDESVSSYVLSFDVAKEYKEKIFDLIDYSAEMCKKEGRTQLVVAFGCTGGHHRSVTFAQALYKHLTDNGYSSGVSHRDILK